MKQASLVVGGGDSKHISSPCLANLDVMVNFVSTFCLSVILIHFITIFAFCICKHNSKWTIDQMFIKYLPQYFPSQKWNKKITFPLLFSIICCLTQYHQQAHLVTLFFCIGTLPIFWVLISHIILWHWQILSEKHALVFSFVFYLTISSPKSDPFSSHFSSLQTFQGRLKGKNFFYSPNEPLWWSRAINPLKIFLKK